MGTDGKVIFSLVKIFPGLLFVAGTCVNNINLHSKLSG